MIVGRRNLSEVFFPLGALAMMGCLAFQNISAADLMAGLWLLGVLKSLLFRLLVGRKDVPPPGFALAVMGMAGASLAAIALSMDWVLHYSVPLRQFWRLLMFQGLLWLPILGVAPYLLPRFYGRTSLHAFAESEGIPAGWMRV